MFIHVEKKGAINIALYKMGMKTPFFGCLTFWVASVFKIDLLAKRANYDLQKNTKFDVFHWYIVFKNNKDSLIRTTPYLLTIEKSPDLLSISPNMSCELCLHAFACDTYMSMTLNVFRYNWAYALVWKNTMFHLLIFKSKSDGIQDVWNL